MKDHKNKGLIRKVTEGAKYHIVDTTALLTSTSPIYAAMEVGISGMSDEVSIGSRTTVAALSYFGMGLAFARGRDISRRIFKITNDTKERLQVFHDAAYATAFNSVIAPPIYFSMGADLKQAVIGGVMAGGLCTVMGPIMGYSVDVARDLTGLKECQRTSYPKLAKKQRPLVKKGLAALLVAGSIAATAGVYSLTPDRDNATLNTTQRATEVQSSK